VKAVQDCRQGILDISDCLRSIDGEQAATVRSGVSFEQNAKAMCEVVKCCVD